MKTFFRNNIKESLASAFFVVCFVCSFLSCSNDYCKEPMDTGLEILFATRRDTSGVSLQSLKVTDRKRNLLLLEDSLNSSSVRLPLAAFDTVSEFRMDFYRGGVPYSKVLVVKHKNTEEFVSAECGCRITSEIDTVYMNNAYQGDSIVVRNKFVLGRFDERNVKIYWNFD